MDQGTGAQHNPLLVKTAAGAIILSLLLVMAATLAVPFLFPTETLWYKAGLDKWMLLTAQLAGLLALLLLLVQILLALRPKLLQQALGAARMLRWHRVNGVLVAVCALVHVVLVLAPEGLDNLPLGWKFWPELLGAASLLSLLATVSLSWWRSNLPFPYQAWRLVHRLVGFLLPALLTAHVLFVSESFARGWPRAALLIAVVLLYLIAALVWKGRGRTRSTINTPRRSL